MRVSDTVLGATMMMMSTTTATAFVARAARTTGQQRTMGAAVRAFAAQPHPMLAPHSSASATISASASAAAAWPPASRRLGAAVRMSSASGPGSDYKDRWGDDGDMAWAWDGDESGADSERGGRGGRRDAARDEDTAPITRADVNLSVGDQINVVVDWFGVLGATVIIENPNSNADAGTDGRGAGDDGSLEASLEEELAASIAQLEGMILQNEIGLFRAARGGYVRP